LHTAREHALTWIAVASAARFGTHWALAAPRAPRSRKEKGGTEQLRALGPGLVQQPVGQLLIDQRPPALLRGHVHRTQRHQSATVGNGKSARYRAAQCGRQRARLVSHQGEPRRTHVHWRAAKTVDDLHTRESRPKVKCPVKQEVAGRASMPPRAWRRSETGCEPLSPGSVLAAAWKSRRTRSTYSSIDLVVLLDSGEAAGRLRVSRRTFVRYGKFGAGFIRR